MQKGKQERYRHASEVELRYNK
ncbi:uncharacterized protein FRV6_14324 [Fusarium oxysporum]|uniref:Uncharacterized protein n=1 Tax=Fusarium oxysporum TaxID=5507 RepID=A0A2H3U3Z1_FUSOX|nr:uncharacterized protein FRV6_14324 [Fusarium oxysporum]